MTGDKTQPQKLLEEIIPKDLPRDENEKYPNEIGPMLDSTPKFPTIEAQQKYWQDKEAAEEPQRDPKAVEMAEKWEANKPRKWSAKRRKAYNAMKKTMPLPGSWSHVPTPPQEEPVAKVRFCPCCGRNIERFLA